MGNFPCIKCGLCCKRINQVSKSAEAAIDEIEPFPYKWDETGKCEKLGADDLCTVYENRPLICNIDRMIDEFGWHKVRFYNLNIDVCNKLLKAEKRTERIDFIKL